MPPFPDPILKNFRHHSKQYQTTTISLPTVKYNQAKAFADERNLTMDELFTILIEQMIANEGDVDFGDLDDEKTAPNRYNDIST